MNDRQLTDAEVEQFFLAIFGRGARAAIRAWAIARYIHHAGVYASDCSIAAFSWFSTIVWFLLTFPLCLPFYIAAWCFNCTVAMALLDEPPKPPKPKSMGRPRQ